MTLRRDKNNLIIDPQHNCYKAPDRFLCRLRVSPDTPENHFECVGDPDNCFERKIKEQKHGATNTL